MKNKISSILFTAFFLFLTQILFVNNINFFGLLNPKLFPIFIILYPRSIPNIYLLIIAFLYAFVIDAFSFTLGVGIFATVLIAFIKPYILKFMQSRMDEEATLSIALQGKNFIARYLFITLFIFHLVYFFTEIGQFYNIFYIIIKALFSSMLALSLYFIFVFMFVSQSQRREVKL
jgi:hypothetical protein